MGLTIHWELEFQGTVEEAREKVEMMHDIASVMPFAEVKDIVYLKGDECDYLKVGRDHPHRWLLIQSRKSVEIEPGKRWRDVSATEIIAFATWPREGCEEANFGLCRYEGFDGWFWHSFCKTQYASEVSTEHFVKCHLLVVGLLDYAKKIGLVKDVSDEGGYWEKRDAKALAETVGEWNEMIAGLAGRLQRAFGKENLEAPILDYQNFEHLEQTGAEKGTEAFKKEEK